MKSWLSFLAALTVISGAAGGSEDNSKQKFGITTRRMDDTVEIRPDMEKTVFVVKSPFGISDATIVRQDDAWPKTVALRLHLKGLENFRVSNGKTTLNASVAIHDGNLRARMWKDGKENAPLDNQSPFWMAVRIIGSNGKEANELHLKDGYFEITLPKVFFEGNPKSLTLTWIDFYRR